MYFFVTQCIYKNKRQTYLKPTFFFYVHVSSHTEKIKSVVLHYAFSSYPSVPSKSPYCLGFYLSLEEVQNKSSTHLLLTKVRCNQFGVIKVFLSCFKLFHDLQINLRQLSKKIFNVDAKFYKKIFYVHVRSALKNSFSTFVCYSLDGLF